MKRVMITSFLLIFCLAVILSYSISAAEKGLWIKSIDATSVLEPEKGTYDQGNIMDLSDDSWCEGKKDDGVGESITIKLDAPAAIKKLHVKNGMGIAKFWRANNRVKDVKINGKIYTLKDVPGFQTVNLPGTATDTITLVISSVYKGEKWSDTCLAEVALADPGDAFNRRDNYAKITGKSWVSAEGMSSVNDGALVFSRGYLFSIDVVPCGDETCPMRTTGSCRPRSNNTYECRSIEHCRGTYDPKLNRAGRVCTDENDAFSLDVSGGTPVVTVKGKKMKLVPFD
ncbi:MAG TPA: hypothetical protein PKX40_09650 [Spirochaetota bacterium]|nr:hypothetical protein [Spirochaetota bacterium]